MQQVLDLRRCAHHLHAADGSLQASSWQGAPAVRGLIHSVSVVIAELYNGAEPRYLELLNKMPLSKRAELVAAQDRGEHQAAGLGEDQENPQED